MADNISESRKLELLAQAEPFAGLAKELVAEFVDEVSIVTLAAGEVLFERGEASDSFFVVSDGHLGVQSEWEGAERSIAEAGPGATVGSITLDQVRTRSATVTARTPATLLKISKESFDTLSEKIPDAVHSAILALTIRAHRFRLGTVMRANPIFAELPGEVLEELENIIEIVSVQSGDVLWRDQSASDCLYIVINGRLRVWHPSPDDTKSSLLSEVGPGDSVGEMSTITGESRTAELRAIRDSTIARLSKDQLMELLRRYPEEINRAFVKVIVKYLSPERGQVQHARNASNTVALIPIGAGVPVREVGEYLQRALSATDETMLLDGARCDDILGMPGFSQASVGDPRNGQFLTWLNDLEFDHQHIIFVADEAASNWTSRCIRQADHLLFVADTAGSPELGEIERQVLDTEQLLGLRKSLLLVHPKDTSVPTETLSWLSERNIGMHHHLRRGNNADFDRLARFLTGSAVGVVLGGGGARGFAHVGVLRALEECGIPIDLVGGTSMGALIAAQYAMQIEPSEILDATLKLCLDGDNFTIPLVSLYQGTKFAKGLRRSFGVSTIEDLWRRYYSVSCNLSRARVMVHDQGQLADAVLASNTPPALFPPMVKDGDLLVDGALLNNVPVDVMTRYNEGGTIIAIDVNPKDDLLANTEYHDGLSGWKVLRAKLDPFQPAMQVPNIMDVLTRATAIGGLAQRKTVMTGLADLYLRPPVSKFPLMGYANAPKIAEAGYKHTMTEIAAWLKSQEEGQ